VSAILGIIQKNGMPVEDWTVNSIKQAIAHRATDGSKIYRHENVVFGHCRPGTSWSTSTIYNKIAHIGIMNKIVNYLKIVIMKEEDKFTRDSESWSSPIVESISIPNGTLGGDNQGDDNLEQS
jgi:hypothetical protein